MKLAVVNWDLGRAAPVTLFSTSPEWDRTILVRDLFEG